MADYIFNRVESDFTLSPYFSSYSEDGRYTTHFDFNKIVPRPKELEIRSSTLTGIPNPPFYLGENRQEFIEMIKKTSRDELDAFCQAIINVKTHGYPNWYYFSCEKWGTKWNAQDTEIISDKEILFETAWTQPFPIFKELTKNNKGQIRTTCFNEVNFDLYSIGYEKGEEIYSECLGEVDYDGEEELYSFSSNKYKTIRDILKDIDL
jgi:hypothetical protein